MVETVDFDACSGRPLHEAPHAETEIHISPAKFAAWTIDDVTDPLRSSAVEQNLSVN